MDSCCIVNCEKPVYWMLLCAEHDAFSPENINKLMPTGEITYVYDGKEIKPIEVDL